MSVAAVHLQTTDQPRPGARAAQSGRRTAHWRRQERRRRRRRRRRQQGGRRRRRQQGRRRRRRQHGRRRRRRWQHGRRRCRSDGQARIGTRLRQQSSCRASRAHCASTRSFASASSVQQSRITVTSKAGLWPQGNAFRTGKSRASCGTELGCRLCALVAWAHRMSRSGPGSWTAGRSGTQRWATASRR